MTDENDSGIDRRKVLKSIGATGALTGAVGMGSETAAGYIDPGDPDDDGGSGKPYSPGFPHDWTAFPHRWEPNNKTAWDGVRWELNPDIIYGDETFTNGVRLGTGYQIMMEPGNPQFEDCSEGCAHGKSELAWEHSTKGPSSGDDVFVWAHGWQRASDRSPEESLKEGWIQGRLAWDGIRHYTNVIDNADHTIAFAWNSASGATGFDNAVEQAHRQGPWHYATFLLDLADRISPGGTLHIGAHSLGCWMTLEALAAAYHDDEYEIVHGLNNEPLYNVLESVRFISAAVPESALGHNGGDEDWVNAVDATYTHAYGTYDEHALKIPNKIINGYFACDEIVDNGAKDWGACSHVDPQSVSHWLATFGQDVPIVPFQRYLENWGSSSAGVGANPVKVGDGIDKSKWINRPIRAGGKHTGVYKHPNYCDNCGSGQDDLWAEWSSYSTLVRVDEATVPVIPPYDNEHWTATKDMVEDNTGLSVHEYLKYDGGGVHEDTVVEMTAAEVEEYVDQAGGGGGGGGGGGDDDIGDDNQDQVLKEY